MATIASEARPRPDLISKLNGSQHYNAMVFYLTVVAAHWLEHGVQAVQVFVLGWKRPEALGLLGSVSPFLVKSELLHYGYALFMLTGLIMLRRAFTGTARRWWNVALVIQIWHHMEHLLLLGQATIGRNLFGQEKPVSVIQLVVPRIELHLLYNMLVLIPLLIAVSLHWFRRDGEQERWGPTCSCAAHFR